jgi:hypothetical protein
MAPHQLQLDFEKIPLVLIHGNTYGIPYFHPRRKWLTNPKRTTFKEVSSIYFHNIISR